MKAKFVQLNEGAWGHFPLDNDVVSDWKWKFGNMILKELKDKIKKGFKSKSYDYDYLYYAIGMWEFFKERLKTQYSFFTDDEIENMDKLCLKVAKELVDNEKFLNQWKDPNKVRVYLENYINTLNK